MTTATCPLVTLHNGVTIPQLGIGLWEANDEEAAENVKWALQVGYRHVDTAYFYKNEVGVGRGIRSAGVPREEIFVVTKMWNSDHGYDQALAAFEKSRTALGLDYIDLYLIHWPGPNRDSIRETWRAFEKLYDERKVRAIGVSNFESHHLDDLIATSTVVPMVNQVEMHPLFQQEKLRTYCQEKGIAVTAWRPLGKGGLLAKGKIVELAKKHERSPAQIILRWFMQLGVITIPKSSHEERIKENFNVFDFELSDTDMAEMRALNEDNRLGGHPDHFFPLS